MHFWQPTKSPLSNICPATMSEPSLYNQYPITALPRVNDVEIEEKLVISQVDTAEGTALSVVDFAVSKSMISSYLVRPSPKLLWSYSLKPSVVVDCMDVIARGDKKFYLCGLTDRRSFQLLLVETNLGLTKDGNLEINTSKEYDLKLADRATGVKFLGPNTIAVAYRSGGAEIVDFQKQQKEEQKGGLTFSGNKTSSDVKQEVVYTSFISDMESKLLLTVSKSENKFIYKLTSLEQNKPVFELKSVQREEASQNCIFTYVAGILFRCQGSEIEALSITNFQSVHRMSVETILESDSALSMRAVAPDRVLLGSGNKIFLINVKFRALLAEFVSISSFSDHVPDKVYVGQAIAVKGQSQNTCATSAFYLNLKNKDNNLYLNVIDLNVGLNKLSECLGKGLNKSKEDNMHNMKELYDDDDATGTISNGHSGGAKKTELQEVLESLRESQKSRDIASWESILIPYLKNQKSWEDIKRKGAKSPKRDKVYQFKEFEVENDRIVDISFIESLFELIFAKNPLKFRDTSFIPEYTLMYLLTNPIFPKEYARDLIPLLASIGNKTLMRQAVNTCLNIPLWDLLQHILKDNDLSVLTDLINRVVSEFPTEEINVTFKKVIESQDQSVDLIELINKLLASKTYSCWVLVEVLINVNGLFTWSNENIENLNSIVDSKLQNLDVNAYNLTLVEQVQLKKNQYGKSHRSNSGTSSSGDAEDGILSITDQTNLASTKVDVVDAKLPLYLVETLDI
ncbi:uncharacterized protein LODBEIA_P21330 [Lodderomyces beijingensis]|uniref:U3 small nucleolar RNA-associated protein 8 n=1 Tax=Lodderomyces beijingensis TaxID=1775926 RepID=A0ABP0ZJ48_9ASCO